MRMMFCSRLSTTACPEASWLPAGESGWGWVHTCHTWTLLPTYSIASRLVCAQTCCSEVAVEEGREGREERGGKVRGEMGKREEGGGRREREEGRKGEEGNGGKGGEGREGNIDAQIVADGRSWLWPDITTHQSFKNCIKLCKSMHHHLPENYM